MQITLKEYHQMAAVGVLIPDDRVELLDGCLDPSRKKTPPRVYSKCCLQELLIPLVEPEWHVGIYAPVTMDTSEPEPDITVIDGAIDRYGSRHPSPSEIGLTIEVEDGDWPQLDPKVAVYARGGLTPLWVVRLRENRVDVYTEPVTGDGGGAY